MIAHFSMYVDSVAARSGYVFHGKITMANQGRTFYCTSISLFGFSIDQDMGILWVFSISSQVKNASYCGPLLLMLQTLSHETLFHNLKNFERAHDGYELIRMYFVMTKHLM